MVTIHSPSSIKVFLKCPMKYRYKYVDQIHSNVVNDPSSYLGMIYHKFLLKYYEELSKGSPYKIFTNEYIIDIINSVSTKSIAKCTESEINQLKGYAFSILIIGYLGKKPYALPKVLNDQLMIEYELKNIPLIHPITKEIMPDTEIQVRYDMVTTDDEIREFKLCNRIFDYYRIVTDIQITMQTYVFNYVFGKMPNRLWFEFMIKTDDGVVLRNKEVFRNTDHFVELWNLISTINKIKTNGLWYRSYPDGCRGCQYTTICLGKYNGKTT